MINTKDTFLNEDQGDRFKERKLMQWKQTIEKELYIELKMMSILNNVDFSYIVLRLLDYVKTVISNKKRKNIFPEEAHVYDLKWLELLHEKERKNLTYDGFKMIVDKYIDELGSVDDDDVRYRDNAIKKTGTIHY
jgi:hypothetical protein